VLYAGYVSEFDFTDDIADLMIECEGNDCDVFESAALIDALTLEEIQQLLQDSFDERSTACTVLTPLEQEEE
jgi:hypothetical protein